jgi:hypothetical protein
MRAIDFSHKITPNGSFGRKKFKKFSPKNDQKGFFGTPMSREAYNLVQKRS